MTPTFSHTHRQQPRPKRSRRHPYFVALEALEERTLLSTNVLITGSAADIGVQSNGGFRFAGDPTYRVGDGGTNAYEQAVVIPFQLPTIPTGQSVSGASLSVYLQSLGNVPSGNVDVYGLGWRSSNTVLTSDYYEGSYGGDSTDATPIQTGLLTPTSAAGTYTTSSAADTALANYIAAQYAAGAPAGSYVFLRLNAQSDQAISRYWVVSSADNTVTAQKPILTVSFDPANIVVNASTADNAVTSTGSSRFVGDKTYRVGDGGTNTYDQAIIIPFQLPTLPAGQTVSTASLSVYLQSLGNVPSGNVDVYGLGWRSSSAVLTSDYYEGSYGGDSTDATPIETGLLTPTSTAGTYITSSTADTALGAYIAAQYAAGASPGSYVFLRLNAQSDQAISRYWTVSTADNTDPTQRPVLTINLGSAATTPTAPSNLSVNVTGSTSTHLAWTDNSSNETGFVVERSTDGISFSAITTTAANATTYDDTTGLSASTLYYYRIKAINSGGSSAYTSIVSDTTLPAFNRTIWVDVNSNAPTPDGTYNNAYKTIASALAVAVAGNGVVVRGGTYTGNVNITVSGTPGNPITLMAAPGERTIISGFAPITGWTLSSGNVYVTTTTSAPSALYAGMTIQEQARSPDGGWYVWQSETTGTQTVITDTAHLTGITNLTGASVELHIGTSNLEATYTILAADPVAGTITTQAVAGLSPTDIYMIKNRASLITQPGEWASEDQGNGTFKVYYWPKAVSDLAITQVPSTTTSMITLVWSGAHDLVVRGFEVAGGKSNGIDLEHGTNLTIQGNTTHDNGGLGIYARYDNNISILNNLTFMNHGGLAISSTDTALIDSNEVAYNANDGMDITGDVSGKQPGQTGFTPSEHITVSNNYVHNQSYVDHSDGIQLYRWLTDVHITDNLVMNNEQGLMTEEVDDVADPGTSFLTGNIIWGSSADLIIFGHSNSNNWTVDNNTIGGGGLGLFQETGTGYNFNDNIIVGMQDARSYTGDHNLAWTTNANGVIYRDSGFHNYTTIAAWYAYSGQDQHSVKGDPLFANVPLVNTEANVVGSTASVLNVRSATGFNIGDHVEVGKDGIVRTITAISGNNITLNIPLAGPPIFAVALYNWGTRTNFNWDFSLSAGSPGLAMSSTGGPVGSTINAVQFAAGDFNGDGKRDVPSVPADVSYPPNLSWWPA